MRMTNLKRKSWLWKAKWRNLNKEIKKERLATCPLSWEDQINKSKISSKDKSMLNKFKLANFQICWKDFATPQERLWLSWLGWKRNEIQVSFSFCWTQWIRTQQKSKRRAWKKPCLDWWQNLRAWRYDDHKNGKIGRRIGWRSPWRAVIH